MLDDKLTKIKNLDSQILDLCKVEEIPVENEESEGIISRILDIQRPIKDGINRVMVKLSTPEESAAVNLPNESNMSNETVGNTSNEAVGNTSNGVNLNATTTNETVTMERTINSSAELSQIRPNLPKLVLSKFKGNVTEWTGFWDSYQTAVHDNPILYYRR